MTEGAPMPAGFLGHGNPMNALERDRHIDAGRDFGACVPKPRAGCCAPEHAKI